jgi:hypothetical protein
MLKLFLSEIYSSERFQDEIVEQVQVIGGGRGEAMTV